MRFLVILFHGFLWISGVLILWQAIIMISGVENFLFPSPLRVALVLVQRYDLLAHHALVTFSEIIIGLFLGSIGGTVTALILSAWRRAHAWIMPLLVISQAIPVFAIAPLLVLWFGFGLASKIAMSVLIIYFPVTAAFYDGLRRVNPEWLDLAQIMGEPRTRGSTWRTLRCIRFPAALPGLASGLRIAVAVAPIGAIIGEWVGASSGLGYLMLQANARLQTDIMFAALVTLAGLAVGLYLIVDWGLRRILSPWHLL